MGYLFDEKKFVNDNVAWIDSHLNSQYSRFLDSAPTYVTYYNVNNVESTVDFGFKNIEKLLGDTSPLRFNKVNNLPIYGIDQIKPDIEDAEEGINFSFDGQAIILPNTVKPIPNDFFIIDYIGGKFIFMITGLDVDGIRDEGYFKVDFTLKYINEDKLSDLERQTTESYDCFVTNIGTEEKVLIQSGDVEIMNKLNKITEDIANYYMILFYDKKYNSFLFNRPNRTRLYDRLLTHFINKHRLFFRREDYTSLLLTVEDPQRQLQYEYHNSLYRAIEERKPELIKPVFYGEGFANDFGSIFYHWGDTSVYTTQFNIGTNPYLNMELIESFKDAKSFYVTEAVEKEVDVEGKINVSIPVGNGEVFTQDAGYGDRSPIYKQKESSTSVVEDVLDGPDPGYKSPVSEIKDNKKKLSIFDLHDLVENPIEEDPVSVRVVNPDLVVDVTKDELTEDFEGEVQVTNLIDKVIEHITKSPEGMDVVGRTIIMYLSGNVNKLADLEIDDLKDYADYMQPTRESFILIPILLYVIEEFYKKSLS